MSSLHYPLRYASARFSRRNPLRKLSVEVIKALYGKRPVLPAGLHEVRPLDMPHISFAPTHSMVMEAAYWYGVRGYEGVVSAYWEKLCAESSNILEIGANVGLFSVIGAAATRGRYVAVEPLPHNAQILRENLKRNGLHGVVVLEAAAIPHDKARIVQLNVPNEGKDAPVGAHLVADVEIKDRSTLEILEVPGLPILELVEGVDLIKIDAEGIEAELLNAAMPYLLRHRPHLMIEVLPEAPHLAALISKLASQAPYSIYVIPEYGSDKIVPVTPSDFHSLLPKMFNSKDVILTTLQF